MEDTVLVDGLPATLFLPEVSNEKVEEYAHRVLRLFSPRLIARISDKLHLNGDIEKVKLVGEIVRNFNPKPYLNFSVKILVRALVNIFWLKREIR